MKRLAIGAAMIVGLLGAYVITHLALIEIGQEIVVLHKWTGDGEQSRPRLWILDDGDQTWLHHGYADTPWIVHLEVDPIVEVERDGETRRYRATPDPAADPKVHRLLRDKYGAADRLVRFWAGTDTERGVASGATCVAVPVRLDPV